MPLELFLTIGTLAPDEPVRVKRELYRDLHGVYLPQPTQGCSWSAKRCRAVSPHAALDGFCALWAGGSVCSSGQRLAWVGAAASFFPRPASSLASSCCDRRLSIVWPLLVLLDVGVGIYVLAGDAVGVGCFENAERQRDGVS